MSRYAGYTGSQLGKRWFGLVKVFVPLGLFGR